ncbi:hypothetical protein V7S43_018010 [Phytophthora oleae]|uniref:Uncharacterized protein n=1 Tax=Phytophthora oleae TaxID=2107226 RepID=A0ABD3ETS8_9STRA
MDASSRPTSDVELLAVVEHSFSQKVTSLRVTEWLLDHDHNSQVDSLVDRRAQYMCRQGTYLWSAQSRRAGCVAPDSRGRRFAQLLAGRLVSCVEFLNPTLQ